MVGLELRKNHIDKLLGPGINIHRNPLNGRNFEYFSEDPYVTGKIAAAQLRGMHRAGVTGTIKHFSWVVPESVVDPFDDNTVSCIEDDSLTRGELLRSAANIYRFILRSSAMERLLGVDNLVEVIGQ
ncbi:glycoside hydrolase family 3 N-terminal domain-containing protein [Alicyclobacillus mengziensis]|uniref:Glycoside hydrolase family 3 N-terminal domain-containing protein n=1 Tax=Alicyclobacillus mengziensis TaxID=2931921 RepID=A0A9X7VZG9_9BACL|nr:hypothetical protein JZ786_19205 [Alicyclobacillus mengziensis]